ncbi:unnamed protein product [Mytilus edulis]|uniref:DZIP3-like HEPN domain-containing protein n=1 Tax=Mytilus edulis TaxID=6550 RepID=A0A8S3V1B2_MYTED|nr:unnamed protein product [Mytilus edulis]
MPIITRSDDCYQTNYARLGHAVQHLLPTFLQGVLLHFEDPRTIYTNCSGNRSLSRRLKPGEWARLSNAAQYGYADFDIPLIYSILRNLHEPAVRPTRGWEHPIEPLVDEIEIGDDIERCRRIRNEIIHRGNTRVTALELKQYFYIFKTIAERLEKVCNKPHNEFVSTVEHLQACCMDETTEQLYLKDIQDLRQSLRDKENEVKILQLAVQLNSIHSQRGHEVFAKIIRGKPDICRRSHIATRQQTKTSPGNSSQVVQTDVITSQSTNTAMLEGQLATTDSTEHTVFQHFISQTECILKDKSMHMSHRSVSLATNEIQTLECERLQIQSDILEEVRNGQYRIEIHM